MRKLLASAALLVAMSACGGESAGQQPQATPTTYTLGGPFGGDDSGVGCEFEGNAVVVRDGTGPIIGTTVMEMTDQRESGLGCFGQATWSVEVPRAEFYRIEMETDLPGRTVVESDLIPFEELKAADFTVYLKTEVDGFDFDNARLVQVSPW